MFAIISNLKKIIPSDSKFHQLYDDIYILVYGFNISDAHAIDAMEDTPEGLQ